jgi:hypothetical protein
VVAAIGALGVVEALGDADEIGVSDGRPQAATQPTTRKNFCNFIYQLLRALEHSPGIGLAEIR